MKFDIDKRYNIIIPVWQHLVEINNWAKQYPDLYTTYTTGMITYHSEEAVTMLMLRWS